jgi:hypothetical protein
MKDLTKEQKEEYVKDGYSKCPSPDCGSEIIDGGFVEVDSGHCHQNCVCNDCGREWTDIYKLVAIEEN